MPGIYRYRLVPFWSKLLQNGKMPGGLFLIYSIYSYMEAHYNLSLKQLQWSVWSIRSKTAQIWEWKWFGTFFTLSVVYNKYSANIVRDQNIKIKIFKMKVRKVKNLFKTQQKIYVYLYPKFSNKGARHGSNERGCPHFRRYTHRAKWYSLHSMHPMEYLVYCAHNH